MNAIDFLASQPENSLDMVYIDTDYTYNTTKLELEAAAIALKPSGLIWPRLHINSLCRIEKIRGSRSRKYLLCGV
jgi:hypothetical protein